MAAKGPLVGMSGILQRTLAGFGASASAAVAAPAFAAGDAGIPVVLGMPKVGNSLAILPADVTGTAPTRTWQWYRTRIRGAAGLPISGATASTYTPTDADTMKQIWVRQIETNAGGIVSAESWRMTCLPASWSVGSGAPTYTSHTSDPDDSTVYSATTIYQIGQPVEGSNGSKYICRVPYAYGQDPVTSVQDAEGVLIWQIVPTSNGVFYIDSAAGNDANAGTKAAPWQTIDAVRKKVLRATPGFSVAAQNALFLFKQGTTISGSLGVNVFTNYPNTSLTTAAKFVFGKYGAGTTRPVWTWAPMLQTVYDATSVFNQHIDTNADGILICDIDFQSPGIGQLRIRRMVANIVGTFAVSDSVSFTGGATGTVSATFSKNGSLYYIVDIISGNVSNNAVMTGPTGTQTCGTVNAADIIYIGGLFGDNQNDWNIARCRFEDISYNGITFGGARQTAIHNVMLRCLSMKDTGAGFDGGGANSQVWFNTATDCGYAGNILGHNFYPTGGANFSFLGNLSEMSANFGNHALVLHGNWSNPEIAYNKGIGTRSGWGLNDGYGSDEAMSDLHFHHNLLQDIGKFTGQSAASIGWEVTSFVGARVHDNVTINTTDNAFYERRGSGGTDTYLQDVRAAHNTFYKSRVFIGGLTAGGLASNMTDINFQNNAFSMTAAFSAISKGHTMADAELTLNYNAYYRSDASTVIAWNVGGTPTNYTTAAALNAAFPAFEANGLTVDPVFVNTTAGSYDLSLQAGSTLRNVGTDVRRLIGFAADFGGTTRDATPHIGAYETA